MPAAIYDVKRLSQADNFEELAVRGWNKPTNPHPGCEDFYKPIYGSKDVYSLRIYRHNPAHAIAGRKPWRYTVEVFAGVRLAEGVLGSLRAAKIAAVQDAMGHALGLGAPSDG